MALTSKISDAIFGGRSQAFLSDGWYDVVFDSVIDFSESDSFQVTKHTIEDGSDITDHVNADPKQISFSAVLTDNDLDILDPTGFFDDTIQDRFDTLEMWKEEKPVLTYFGHETDIENVVITSIARDKTLDTGEGWGISISLIKISVAVSIVVAISLTAVRRKGRTSKGVSTKAGSATANKNKSIAKNLLG